MDVKVYRRSSGELTEVIKGENVRKSVSKDGESIDLKMNVGFTRGHNVVLNVTKEEVIETLALLCNYKDIQALLMDKYKLRLESERLIRSIESLNKKMAEQEKEIETLKSAIVKDIE